MSELIELSRKDPAPLLGGSILLSWINAGGMFDRQAPLHHFKLKWSAYWFDRHLSSTVRRCAKAPPPCAPTFILGLWRSGTTVLHHALSNATRSATPHTWQCFRPADFLLSPEPRSRHEVRPMDEGRIGTFTPQEDEFAALLLGEASVYRAFLDPRRMAELTPLLRAWRNPAVAGSPPLSENWEVFLKAVCLRHPGPLLLKSPNHSFRLPWLAQRFPKAQFIWLTRNREDVLASNMRMWTAMIDRYSLWRGKIHELQLFLEEAVVNHDALLDWGRRAIPDRLHVVDFTRTINDRANVVQELVSDLNLRSRTAT